MFICRAFPRVEFRNRCAGLRGKKGGTNPGETVNKEMHEYVKYSGGGRVPGVHKLFDAVDGTARTEM